jgi:hypothetical protein
MVWRVTSLQHTLYAFIYLLGEMIVMFSIWMSHTTRIMPAVRPTVRVDDMLQGFDISRYYRYIRITLFVCITLLWTNMFKYVLLYVALCIVCCSHLCNLRQTDSISLTAIYTATAADVLHATPTPYTAVRPLVWNLRAVAI